MKRLWHWWEERCARTMDVRVLALVRILVALCVIGDLLQVASLGLVDDLFRPWDAGGINQIPTPDFWLEGLLGPRAGFVAYGGTLACMVLIALGIAVRPAIVVGVLCYAQLGHGFPFGDRAVDRILRFTLLVLLCSGSHRRFALGGGPRAERIAAWPAQLLKWFLVLVYTASGLGKLGANPDWLGWGDTPPLYRVLSDPMAAWLDPVAAQPWWPLFQLGSWATVAVELSAVLILTRWAPWWALAAMWIHIGIAATMKLGMFSYGMLALYPLLFAPWLRRGLDRLRDAGEART